LHSFQSYQLMLRVLSSFSCQSLKKKKSLKTRQVNRPGVKYWV
jgi:hypothetical protein